MKALLEHGFRFIGRHAGGQLIISNLQINKEFMSHVFHTYHFTRAGTLGKGFIGERDKLRAHAKENLLILMGLNFALQQVVERQSLIAQRQMQATVVLNQLAGRIFISGAPMNPATNIFFGWW